MDKFEYATLSIWFDGKVEYEAKANGHIDFTTFQSDGKSVGVPKVQTYDLDGEFVRTQHREVFEFEEGYDQARRSNPVRVHENFSLVNALVPYFAMLGMQGWEVVDYKTNADPAFGQALLKRKIEQSVVS